MVSKICLFNTLACGESNGTLIAKKVSARPKLLSWKSRMYEQSVYRNCISRRQSGSTLHTDTNWTMAEVGTTGLFYWVIVDIDYLIEITCNNFGNLQYFDIHNDIHNATKRQQYIIDSSEPE